MSRSVFNSARRRLASGMARRAVLSLPVMLAASTGVVATPAYAEGPACPGDAFAGRWRNVAMAEGSDVVAADIRVDCADDVRIEIALTVRCLRYECAWRPVRAVMVRLGTLPHLRATYAEERVERAIEVAPVTAERIGMTVTTRFLRTNLEPRRVTYTLERIDD